MKSINRCLSNIMKAMDKLQSIGVVCNLTYCLPQSGAIMTRGWDSISQLILRSISSKDNAEFNETVQRDLAKIKTSAPVSSQDPLPILGEMPLALKSNRDQLRPLLTDMVRISQSKGMY